MPRRRERPEVSCQGSSGSGEGEDDSDSGEKPQQRNAANARERARMRVLSRAFCRLKTTLPWVPPDTKLSKLDTLRLATSYIAHLRAVLCLDDEDEKSAVHPLNLTWPFTFHQGGSAGTGSGSPTSRPPWEPSLPRGNPQDSSSHCQLVPGQAYHPHAYHDSLLQMG